MAAAQPLIYVENNVGRRFVNVFNEFSVNHGWGAVFQNDIHSSMQHPQHGDVWWIEAIAELGYALLTCDMAIVGDTEERDTVIKSGLRYVGFADAEYDGWTQLRVVSHHWDRLSSELDLDGPVIIKLGISQIEVERE